MQSSPNIMRGYLLSLVLAIVLPSMVMATGPDDYQVRVQELLADSQYKQVVKVLDEAAAKADDDSTRQQALMQQGDIYYYYLEDYKQALTSYGAAYEADPKTKTAANALYRRGLIYMDKLEDKDSAVKEFEVVLENFPKYHKKDELKRLLKGTLSKAYKLDLIQRK